MEEEGKEEYNVGFPFENDPLYKKAMHISDLVDRVAEIVEKEAIEQKDDFHKEIWAGFAFALNEDVMMMSEQVFIAKSNNEYDILMENATLIRKNANEILRNLNNLQFHGFKDIEYLDIIRVEFDEFRILFAEWVKTFDPTNYYIDRWGLFNPPGVNYDDEGPERNPFISPFDELYDDDEDWNNFINQDEWDELDDDDDDDDDDVNNDVNDDVDDI
ncbi:MAG: hypothetical protein GW863_13015 [Flavobacteriales bacterium]|nr:hypothetical protein [Flavobacteriales bacterium]